MHGMLRVIAASVALVFAAGLAQAQKFDGEFWIGAYEPMSGPGGALGIGASRGVGLAIDKWNWPGRSQDRRQGLRDQIQGL